MPFLTKDERPSIIVEKHMSKETVSSLMDEAGAFFLQVRTGRSMVVIPDDETVLKMSVTSFSVRVEEVGQVNLMT